MTQSEYLDRFRKLAELEVETTRKKNTDYAGSDNAFKNFQLIEVLSNGRISTADGIMVRMTDKLQRAMNLISRKQMQGEVSDEGIADTLTDLAVYSKILRVYLEGVECPPVPFPTPQETGQIEELEKIPAALTADAQENNMGYPNSTNTLQEGAIDNDLQDGPYPYQQNVGYNQNPLVELLNRVFSRTPQQ